MSAYIVYRTIRKNKRMFYYLKKIVYRYILRRAYFTYYKDDIRNYEILKNGYYTFSGPCIIKTPNHEVIE